MDIAIHANCELDKLLAVQPSSSSHSKNLEKGLWRTRSVTAFFIILQIFGVMPWTKSIVTRQPRYAIRERLGQILLVTFSIIVLVLDTSKSIVRYRNRLTNLEFTAVALAVCRFFYGARAIITMANLFFISGRCSTLLATIDGLCDDPGRKIQRKVEKMALLFSCLGMTSLGLSLYAVWRSFDLLGDKMAAEKPECAASKWSCGTAYPLFTKSETPVWGTFVLYLMGFTLELGIDLFNLAFTILLIYPIGLQFSEITRALKTSLRIRRNDATIFWNSPPDFLRQQTLLHLKLARTIMKIDKTFSFLLLLVYLSDLMGFISGTSLLLHYRSKTTGIGGIDRELVPIFLGLICMAAQQSILRTVFGVWLNEKAHSALPYLHEVNLRVTTEEEKFLCGSFISRLQGTKIALTAGGFFYITREFVITIFGVLFTYILFAYQMHDQKQDMSHLPTLDDLSTFFSAISVSAFPKLSFSNYSLST